MALAEKTMTKGRVVQILGGVVDVEFPPEQLPEIFEAITIPRDGQNSLVLEVQKHMKDVFIVQLNLIIKNQRIIVP